jgi:putative membrane protein
MWYGHWGWGIFWFGRIFLLALVLIIIWLVVRVRRDGRMRQGEGSSFRHIDTGVEAPLEILKKRYARGEINKDEFDRIKDDLRD